jgi:AcrR family transcriptional regulator
MASIARAVDLTPAALYRYFPNKGALLASAIAEVLRGQRVVAHRLVALASVRGRPDPLLALMSVVEVQIALAQEQPEAFALMSVMLADPRQLVEDLQHATHVPELVALLVELRAMVEDAVAIGQLQPGSAQNRATTLVFAVTGVLHLRKLQRFRPSLRPDVLAREAAADLLRGWGATDEGLQTRQARAIRLAQQSIEEAG